MNFYDYLIDELKAGVKVEVLADDFTDALNKAVKQKEKLDKEEKEKALARAKEAEANVLAEAYSAFIRKYYAEPNYVMTGKDIIDGVETALGLKNAFCDLFSALDVPEEKVKKEPKYTPAGKDKLDDLIDRVIGNTGFRY